MIKGKLADIILIGYLLGTLYLRFSLEGALQSHPMLSIALGAMMLFLLWVVIKLQWLQPDYLGFFGGGKGN